MPALQPEKLARCCCVMVQGMERLWSGGATYGADLTAAAGTSGGGGGRGRVCCQWGHHPRTLLLSTGARLLSVDVRAAGGAVVPLWACAPGEGLLALAPSGQVRS